MTLRMILIPFIWLTWGAPSRLLITGMEATQYCLIALLIVRERERLQEYNIDSYFIVLFLVCGTVVRLLSPPESAAEIALQLSFWLTAAAVIASLRGQLPSPDRIPKTAIRHTLVGLILGALLAATTLALPLAIANGAPASSLLLALPLFAAAIPHGPIIEEPVFRGFLLAIIKRLGVRQGAAILIQAFAFMLSHLYYYHRPYTFAFVVPLTAIVLGMVASRDRAVSGCTVAHAMFNAIQIAVLGGN
jgi:membrane protease YdiL (CAAX protease family)